MLGTAERDSAARLLWHAERHRSPIAPLVDTFPGLDIADAYDIQLRNVRRKVAAGSAICGHKVGLSSSVMQQMMGVDQPGRRFVNEATDYMSFGQHVLARERSGNPVQTMWLVFDQRYRNGYLLAAELFPRMPIPKRWYDTGIANRSDTLTGLAESIEVPAENFAAAVSRFNEMARVGKDDDFGRGASAYDRYYGDPTISPNPNLRALTDGPFYAIKVVLSDLGTCGGLRADARARVLREDGSAVEGPYAIGNTAANVFGATYPGAGATIAQGLVFGYIAAQDAAKRVP